MNEFGVGVCSVDGLLVLLPKGLMTGLVLSLQLQKKSSQWWRNWCFLHEKAMAEESPWLRCVYIWVWSHSHGYFLWSLPSIHGLFFRSGLAIWECLLKEGLVTFASLKALIGHCSPNVGGAWPNQPNLAVSVINVYSCTGPYFCWLHIGKLRLC